MLKKTLKFIVCTPLLLLGTLGVAMSLLGIAITTACRTAILLLSDD